MRLLKAFVATVVLATQDSIKVLLFGVIHEKAIYFALSSNYFDDIDDGLRYFLVGQ